MKIVERMRKVKNRLRKPSPAGGVTLAEALIMIIVASACLVPILGTLNHGLSRGKALELRAAMQNLAESHLNAIIEGASYRGVPPVDSTRTVAYPNDAEPDYNFLVSVKVNSG